MRGKWEPINHLERKHGESEKKLRHVQMPQLRKFDDSGPETPSSQSARACYGVELVGLRREQRARRRCARGISFNPVEKHSRLASCGRRLPCKSRGP